MKPDNPKMGIEEGEEEAEANFPSLIGLNCTAIPKVTVLLQSIADKLWLPCFCIFEEQVCGTVVSESLVLFCLIFCTFERHVSRTSHQVCSPRAKPSLLSLGPALTWIICISSCICSFVLMFVFLATLVALHLTPVSKWVSEWVSDS